MIKVLRLKIKNIGIIEKEIIEFNKPLLLFYGDVRQGKTTILNAVKWVLGAPWPTDIIRHGEIEAKILLEFEGGSVYRRWYVAKDGTTKADAIEFVKDGQVVKKPTYEIQKFLNPFLLNQDHFKNLSEKDRKAFLVELFGIDTREIDTKIVGYARDAQDLRSNLKGYGEIDTTPVEKVDAVGLKIKLREIREEHESESRKVAEHNDKINDYNRSFTSFNELLTQTRSRIEDIKASLAKEQEVEKQLETKLRGMAKKPLESMPSKPDTSALEEQISNAAAQNVRYEQYQANLKRAQEKAIVEESIKDFEMFQREFKQEKKNKLAELGQDSGIVGLEFTEDGDFLYEATSPEMLSTSQLMRLSSALSSLYPEGFGLELIDRGESLGRSIMEFVEKAKVEEKTILVTIVGEAPAQSPEEIGVFVVEDGEILEVGR